MSRELPQNKELRLKNVDLIIEEGMKYDDLKSREEVFAAYPNLAQWWAQEYSAYGEGQERSSVAAGGHDRQSR